MASGCEVSKPSHSDAVTAHPIFKNIMKRIYVLQARWVLIGEATDHSTYVELHNAAVIRVWGTTAGLGQIALSGPTANTDRKSVV